MLPINGLGTAGWSWCAFICGSACYVMGGAGCVAICAVDGPIPAADAAAFEASYASAGAVGVLAAAFASS